MNELRRFEFYSNDRRDPYIQKLLEYTISETEGIFHFDGYYYVMNEEFPKHIFFNTNVRDAEPYEEEVSSKGHQAKYKILENNFYEIEIYDREKLKNTSSYDETEDEDGSKMRICYFPTHEQKIYFKVITTFNSFEDFLKRIKEYFTEEREREEEQRV